MSKDAPAAGVTPPDAIAQVVERFERNRAIDSSLRSQIVTLKRGQHRKYPAFAFTEEGIAMLSIVLRSGRAIRQLMQRPKPEPEASKRKIGFQVREPFVPPYGASVRKVRGEKRKRA